MYISLASVFLLIYTPFVSCRHDFIPEGPVRIQVYQYSHSYDRHKPCTENPATGCLTEHGTWNEEGRHCAIFHSDAEGRLSGPSGYLSLTNSYILGPVEAYEALVWSRNRGRLTGVRTLTSAAPDDFLVLGRPDATFPFGPYWYAGSKAAPDGSYALGPRPSQTMPRGTYGLCYVAMVRDL
ncbi:hypothetical protein BJX70DRAFT_396375 [Aspergillus crustosus]